ncbi:MAG: sigma 54-interacting transcriptional regulator [Acidobacteria bacterium]|nr:sigma 54-interacting transcriptional regulator [Acidobacteriota bacterium]
MQSASQQIILQDAALFEQYFEFSPDAILVTDGQGRITRANAQTEKLFGYARPELIGEPVEILIPERFRRHHGGQRAAYTAAARMRPMGAGLELFGRRRDGSEFPVDIMLSPIDTADGGVVLAVIRDISAKHAAEQALRRSEQQFRSLFDFSPDCIVVTDATGRITQANPQLQRLFGYSAEELVGQPVEVLVPERFRAGHSGHRASYNSAPRPRPMGAGLELLGRRKDGSEFPVDVMLGPVETPEARFVITVVRDLTEKKRAEAALRESQRLREEKEYLEEELNLEHSFEDIIGDGPGLRQALNKVETVAPTTATVLILGETGTGKELIARAIHRLSPRHERTFVKLNCAAIPSGLMESELFGHEKGAFTGAITQKVGRLELANQGTLFLDEIGDLPLELQPKLLRALQEKEFERLGSTRTIPVNVRLVAATNRDLAKMVADREFRSDLFYRLQVFPITLPPLRERREDIPLLVNFFVQNHSRRLNKKIETVPPEAMEAFVKWNWPGNIRELENFIERAVILTRGAVLRAPLGELQAPAEYSAAPQAAAGKSEEPRGTLEDAEREHIIRVLRETHGAIGGPDGAAARLGLKRTTLNSKIKKLGIERGDYI